ncbi:hypothetical protein GN244_ATG19190 [Phytophthora infestans]|uniref:No apical meristem-associated C-terminal domain-containing protein n=1 Tax=Phytophthora infestans TaxID=4787 RepID=A0A833SJY5_PHYIN|nr:hypothetical protein GN244_ATG19190 [Phytophthora infestans]KAF4134488.1 hypothetical protein GN958_ATG16322 [Phytophthora infestans]KAF4136381.1 hypothetical protein GN958_ATG14442 [Phytophthora infestans]
MATAKNSGKKPNMYWDKDGVDGGKSSLDVLLDWMTIDTNYNRWHGADRTTHGKETSAGGAKKEELRLKKREAELKEERNKREAEQAIIALAIQQVQLETAKRDSIVQLLLARKRLADNSIPDAEIDLLLPMPTHTQTAPCFG